MRNMTTTTEESDVTNPLPPSTAEAEDENSDEDELNSSIEALDWSDIDAELEEHGSEDFPNVMENLRKSMSSLHGEPRAEGETGSKSSDGTTEELDGEPRPRKLVAVMRIRSGTSQSSEDAAEKIDSDESFEELAPAVPPTILPEDERPESDYGSGDVTSNAPVLDDGPIWSKGCKKYRFVENRRTNRILTIGVILTVVLALGIGLGNLVAVNECEEELKVASRPAQCSCTGGNPFQEPQPIVPVRAAPYATSPDIFDSSSASHIPKSSQFKVEASGNEEILPFMPPPQPDFPTAAERPKWSEGPEFQTPENDLPLPSQKLSQMLKVLGDLADQLEEAENISRAYAAEEKAEIQKIRLEMGLPAVPSLDEPDSAIIRRRYDEILRSTGIFAVDEDKEIYDPLEHDDDEISLELDTTEASEPVIVPAPAPAPEPVKEARNPNFEDSASKKRNKFKINKNPEDKLHKKREKRHRQTPKGEYDFDSSKDEFKIKKSSNDAFHKIQKPSSGAFHKIQKRKSDAFQDRDKPKKPKYEKYDENFPSKMKDGNFVEEPINPNRLCSKQKDGDENCKKSIKVKKVKREKKHDSQPYQVYPEWQTLRAKVRKEARQREFEHKKQADKNWYFARAKGREKSRH